MTSDLGSSPFASRSARWLIADGGGASGLRAAEDLRDRVMANYARRWARVPRSHRRDRAVPQARPRAAARHRTAHARRDRAAAGGARSRCSRRRTPRWTGSRTTATSPSTAPVRCVGSSSAEIDSRELADLFVRGELTGGGTVTVDAVGDEPPCGFRCLWREPVRRFGSPVGECRHAARRGRRHGPGGHGHTVAPREVDALARLLARLDPDEVALVVALLTASPRAGRARRGLARLMAVDAPHADAPTPDHRRRGSGVRRARGGIRTGLGRHAQRRARGPSPGARPPAEWGAVCRVVLGELRTGALEGVLLDAVARAAADRPRHPSAGPRCSPATSAEPRDSRSPAPTSTPWDSPSGGRSCPMLASTAASVADALAETARRRWSRDSKAGPHPGDRQRRRRPRLHTEPRRRHPSRARDRAGRARPRRARAHPRRRDALARRGRRAAPSRTRCRASAPTRCGGSSSARGSSTSCTSTDAMQWKEPLSVRLAELERVGGVALPVRCTADGDAPPTTRRALAAGHEGVVVKAIDSVYAAGRRGKSWVKVEPVLTYDLVVLACESGMGRRTGGCSNLHLGALDRSESRASGDSSWSAERRGSHRRAAPLAARAVPAVETHPHRPHGAPRADHGRRDRDRRVQRSPRYPGGLALRFARVKAYRPDKSPRREADTIQTLREGLGWLEGRPSARRPSFSESPPCPSPNAPIPARRSPSSTRCARRASSPRGARRHGDDPRARAEVISSRSSRASTRW